MIRKSLMVFLAVSAMFLGLNGVSAEPVKLKVSEHGKYGSYLTDSEGRAVYVFEADKQGMGVMRARSECYAECAKAWPPLVTYGAPLAAARVDGSLVGITQRLNGASQVTYDGWPLYYFRGDTAPGQTGGQEVEGFGGEWYLVTPDGDEVDSGGWW